MKSDILELIGVDGAGWDDWHWQLAHSTWDRQGLERLLKVSSLSDGQNRTLERFPMKATPFYLSMARSRSLSDPILMQCVPQVGELEDLGGAPDPFCEEEASPVPRLVHRYYDRALLLSCSFCAVRCRHCMRKRVWDRTLPAISDSELEDCVGYLENHHEVREVLISGGDPLVLEDNDIDRILKALARVSSLDMIRIGSRTLVTLPQRYTEELCALLGNCGKTVWIASHFNHPDELSPEAECAVRRLMAHGVPVVNQSVLLKGINDNADILARLFTGLLKMRIKPYYLFHGDPVKGTTCFRTGIEAGVKIMSELRARVSGMALPAFAIDLPGGGGKVRLEPDSYIGESVSGIPIYRALDGSPVEYV